ncbi:MAG: family 16 glycosylhydrolase [Candidatus Nanosynbacter sp.]
MTKRKLVTTSIATLIVIGGLSLGALHFLSQVNNAPPQATKYADRTTSPTGSLSTDNRSHSDTNSTNDNQQPSKPNQNTDNKPTPAGHNWVTQTMRHNHDQAQAAKQQPERQRGSQGSTQRANQSPRNNSSNNNSGNKNSGSPSQPQPVKSGDSANHANHDQNQAAIDGWQIDYFEGFDSSIKQTKWVQYGWGDPAVGHGCMGVMSQRNSFTQDGKLVIRTQHENGQWSTGGAGSGDVFTASRGRWEIRAKFPKAKGVGYAFLLWPKDEGWPPEVDFAEGRVNGPRIEATYHWDPDNKQKQAFLDNHDMHGWHTYGVIVEKDHIIFTLDGKEWGRINHPDVTDKQMFLGVQAGAMDPNGINKHTETVDGSVPNPLTPAVADIEVDYVAHYVRK